MTLTSTFRFHNAFFEASENYYNGVFKDNEIQQLYKNAIDYYTEKWCQNKKPYERSKDMEKKLKKRGQSYEVEMFRLNTKSQKIKNGKQYNKRKLNELLGFILHLSDPIEKIEALSEHIYFNYEFMHAKATLKQLDFVIDTHEKILALKDEIKKYESENDGKMDNDNNLVEMTESK